MSVEDHAAPNDVAVDGSLSNDCPQKKEKRPRGRITTVLVFLGRSILAAFVFSAALVLCLRWLPPPTSSFMIQRHFAGLSREKQQSPTLYRWVAWESISPHMPLAAVAAEDQKFSHHQGFDFESISKAVEKNRKGGRLRGASTITQQVAKNLFLWSGKSYVRKGLEAYFTVLLEALWSKRRILEVYLNIAEFGEGTYGVSAAAENLLGKNPGELTRADAALLAAVLPNPKRLKVRSPSPYVKGRTRWIVGQMEQLGGDWR